MADKTKVLAILPAHCEEEHIGSIIVGLKEHEFDVLVIDDCSTDDTALVAERAGARVLRLPVNLGYGGALQTGYLYARDGGYGAVVQLDADGQHDPARAKDLLAPILADEADIVMGSRFQGSAGYRMPVIRSLGQKMFGGLASVLTGQRIIDPTTGYQALSGKVVSIYCSELFPDDYPDADMRIIHHRLGIRVKEISIEMSEGTGKSMHSGLIRPLYYVYKMTIALFIALIAKLPRRDKQ